VASASAARVNITVSNSAYLKTNTTFMPGETITIHANFSGLAPYTGTLYLNVSNSTWHLMLNHTTITSTSKGYGNTVGWLNATWTTTNAVAGKKYTIGLYYNSSALIRSANVSFTEVSVSPTGTIQASSAVTFYVNVSACSYKAPVINLTAFGLGNVTATYVNKTTNSYGVPVYVYKATVNLSKATYTSKTFNVRVFYTSSYNKSYSYSLKVVPNKPYQWVVLESTTNGVSQLGLPASDDSAVPASLGATVINATEYIGVADQYGNVNTTFPNTYTATMAVVSGPGSLNRTTVTVDSAHPYAAVRVSVLTSEAPCDVTIQPYGSGLVPAEKTIKFYQGIDHLSLSVSKNVLYANNTDSAKLYVTLKDSKGDTIPMQGVSITVSEVTTLGLKFDGKVSATATTNASGIAVFTVTAGTKSGLATIRAVVTGSPSFPWNGKFGSYSNLTLLQAPSKTYTSVNWPSKIVAGVKTPITITLKDYDDQPIKDCDRYPIKFNITSGDAKWLENNGTCYEITKTDANGNATAVLYTTNATNNKVTISVSYKNEAGKWVYYNETYQVKPNKVYRIAIYYNGKNVTSYAYPVGVTQTPQFTVKYLDAYGNFNTSSGTVKIVPKTSIVGSFASDTVSITNGVGNVSFTTNKSAPAGASATFIFNDSTYHTGNVTLEIVSSGVKGLTISVPSYPKVNSNIAVSAQLTGAGGTPLAKGGVKLTMTVLQPNGTYMKPEYASTYDNGTAIFHFTGVLPGEYSVKVYNTSYGISNATTVVFVGNPVRLILAANKTTVTKGSAVEFTVKTVDKYGMPSVPSNRYVDVLVDGILKANVTLGSTNATAVFDIVFNDTGNHTVYAMCVGNTSMHDEVTVNVVPPKTPANISITNVEVTPTSVEVGKPVTITIYAENTHCWNQDCNCERVQRIRTCLQGERYNQCCSSRKHNVQPHLRT